MSAAGGPEERGLMRVWPVPVLTCLSLCAIPRPVVKAPDLRALKLQTHNGVDFAWESLDAQTGPLMQQDTEGIGDGAEDNDQLTTAPHIPDGQS